MINVVVGFDWDDGNREKCQKHGVSVADIEFALMGDLRVTPDPAHSDDEERFIGIGRTEDGKAIFVAFTFRFKGVERLIRPISARYMHKKEIHTYEKKGS
ncbi:MAG TPA: BrnT family toxin [Micropepsaceae bacterium]|nr:BrnT family toxin [Micropepsaceae bacterium]